MKIRNILLSTDQWAAYFQSTPRTFNKYIGNHIPKVHKGNQVYHRTGDIALWMAQNMQENSRASRA